MADLSPFTLEAILKLNSSEYDKGLNNAMNSGSKLGGVLKTAFSVGAAAIGAATTAVTAFATSAVQVGSSFDSSMSQVAATMGYTVEQLNTAGSEAANTFNTLSEFAQQMGSTTAFSASQAADALNYMALAGYDADTSMKMLPNVLNLAAAGGIELAAASNMVTDAQSALGLSLEETSELVDKMAKASSKSNTSVEQLGSAILTIGGTAKSMAGGTTELAAALGILADNGIKGAEGGTALRNVLLGIQGDKFSKTFGELGVKAYDAGGNLRELSDILDDMNAAMKGMTDQQKTSLINDTFNARDLKTVNALLATTTDRWEELSGAIDDSSGAAQAMAEVQLDNLAGDITLFKSALEGAKIAVSDELTPSIRKFVQFGSEGISKLTEAFKSGGLSGAMEAFGEILSDGLNMVVKMLPKAVEAGAKLLSALGEGIMNNIDLLIDTAVSIVIKLSEYLIQALPELVKAGAKIIVSLAKGLAESLPDLIPTIVDVVLEIVDTLTDPDTLSSLVDASIVIIVTLAEGLIDALPKLIEKAPEIISNLVEAIVENLPKIWQAGVDLLFEIVKAIKDNLESVWDAAVEIVNNILEGIRSLFTKLWDIGKDTINKIWDGLTSEDTKQWGKDIATKIRDGIRDMLKRIWDTGKEIITELWNGFKELKPVQWAADLVKDFIDGIKRDLSNIWNIGKDIIDNVWEGLTSLNPLQWGKDLISNFVDGIKQGWNTLKTGVSDIAQGIKNFIGFSEPKEGPLSNFHTFAPDMMELFAKGIKDNERMLQNTVADAFDFEGAIAGNAKSTSSGFNVGGMTVNVYGSDGMSVRELADEVERRIVAGMQTLGVTYA